MKKEHFNHEENGSVFLTANQAAQILNVSLSTMKKFIYDRLQKHNIQHVSNEGCVATGSAAWILTFIIWVEGEDPKSRQVMQDLFADATEYACSNGWYPDCHQGWGTRMMAKYWPTHHYEFMKTLKAAMDPNNIMNPGIWNL